MQIIEKKYRKSRKRFKKWWFGMKKINRPSSVLSACAGFNAALEMEEIKQVIIRFSEIVDSLECMCEDGHDCTIHNDRLLAVKALKIFEDKN